jgi:hypothetical protein
MSVRDVKTPVSSLHSFSPVRFFYSAFLPTGFPDSVSKDYPAYQAWDSLQAAASTVLAVLSSAAVLQASLDPATRDESNTSNGVALTAGASLALSLLSRDMWTRLASVTLSTASSRVFDGNPKQWRMAADLLNDAAMAAELLLMPALLHAGAEAAWVLVLAAIARAIVGVAGGATRATFALHQAGPGGHNVGELAAKDGNQETAVNLVGSALGASLLLSVDGDAVATRLACISLMALHIYANYRACQVCALRSLNRHRLLALLQVWGERERKRGGEEEEVVPRLPTPDDMRFLEPLLPTPSSLWGPPLPPSLGLPLSTFIRRTNLTRNQIASSIRRTGIALGNDSETDELLIIYTARCQARAIHALSRSPLSRNPLSRSPLSRSPLSRAEDVDSDWELFEVALRVSGWEVENVQLFLGGGVVELVD